ncbi:FHA domain-containing protein PS1 [Senna tora]|uniref:FHA domain-containing protein PS1 n=1 Tax=Senna tora TaxID=362788 RepID=A0A834WHZ5_9FABA|nr:FHA domain-containing protein PS1 [Senna tora]
MGDNNQQPLPEEDDGEMKIPVFTVLKNGAVLKNIFIVNKSPEPQSLLSDHDDVLIVGRHPDCNIMLTHPSISRFHLQIHSNASSQKLSVLDLSSVHGTWVSERRIQPGVSVELKEGDTLRIGGSSRVYRLHWIPISRAYDLENPFVSELGVAVQAEKREEDDAVPQEEKEIVLQNENSYSVHNEEVKSVDSTLESINCPDEDLELIVKKEIPSAPSMPEDITSFYCDEEGNCPSKGDHQEGNFGIETSNLHTDAEIEKKVCDIELQVPSPPHVESELGCDNLNASFHDPEEISTFSVNLGSLFHVEEEFKACPEVMVPRETNILSTLGEYLRESICFPVVEAVQGTTMQQFQDVQQNAPPDAFTSQLPPFKQMTISEKHWTDMLTNLDPASFGITGAAGLAEMPKETGAENLITDKMSLPVEEATVDTEFQQVKIIEEVFLDSLSDGEKQNKCCQEQSKFLLNQNASSCHEQGNSMDGIDQDIGNECPGSISLISLPAESLNTPLLGESILEITNKKKNLVVAGCSEKKNSTSSKIWSRRDKENFSPNTLQLQFLKKKNKQEEIKHSKSRKRSHNLKNSNNYPNGIPISAKENWTLKVTQEQKLERRPFGSHNKFEQDISDMSNQNDITNKVIPEDLLSDLDEEEEEIYTPDKENFSPNTLHLQLLKKKGKVEEIKHFKSQQRAHNSKVAQAQKSDRRPFGSHNKLEQDINDMSNQEDITNKTISKNLFCDLDEEEEIYTPDKENFSPNTLQLQLLKKNGKLEEIEHSKSRRSHNSSANFSSKIYPDENNIPISVAEEQKLNSRPFGSHIELEQEKDIMDQVNGLQRLPFQSLLVNSGGKCRAETSRSVSAVKHINASNPSRISERSWNMVVDTASLLNKDSRKALLLLQGLKGTRLIIPRMVIKELDTMKRQFSFFRRTSEASMALEWIEECMVNTKWWIQVQSSMEDGRSMAPTPPATPQTQFSEEGWTSLLSSHKSSTEIVSPTAEDHILDCALLYRRKQSDGQLVLLSNDATLKIKSMAEGLLCESVEEFRGSLVNPFSERFLWTSSSPRGLTWSLQDDVVLREKYCRSPLRKSSKGEGARAIGIGGVRRFFRSRDEENDDY